MSKGDTVVTVPMTPGFELSVNGLRFSGEIFRHLAPDSGEWRGPLWIRRNGDTAELTTVDPKPLVAEPKDRPMDFNRSAFVAVSAKPEPPKNVLIRDNVYIGEAP